jgi:predicted metal-dependent hydrolase
VLLGNIEDKNLCKKMLIKWVKDQAKKHLTKRLAELSEHTGLHYSNLTIRNQTTRWGSCSSVKAISLNYKLIFLAPEITDYIIIHELCHTVHMNHSARFWRLVSQWDAGWKEHSRAARRADKLIPAWATEFYVAN